MRGSSRFVRSVLVGILALTFVVPFAPTSAGAYDGTITTHALVNGRDLNGLSADEAAAAISTGTPLPALPPVRVSANKKTFMLNPASALRVDVEAMLNEALTTTTVGPFELPKRYYVRTATVDGWLTMIGKQVNRKAVNSTWVVSGRTLVATKSQDGITLSTATSKTNLVNALTGLRDGGRQVRGLALPVSVAKASITQANIGKAILVSKGTFRVALYQGTTRLKYYPCAVGQPAYPTPTGTFKIIDKDPAPDWTNPWSSWSMNMPAYIPPGPNNPLGTRALYLNAPGIRIHGIPVSENESIGTAASHGCIRMFRHDIEELYPLVPIGTPVFIIK